MKQDSSKLTVKVKLFIVINIIVFITVVVYIFYMGKCAAEAAGDGVFYVTATVRGSETVFTEDEITIISEKFTSYDISYEAPAAILLENEIMSAYSPVIYTNTVYPGVSRLWFTYGSFFGVENSDESSEDAVGQNAIGQNAIGQNAIVINEALAWKLFGSLDVCGQELIAGSRKLVVTGVVEQGTFGQENFMAWLPYELRGYMPVDIQHMFIKAHEYNKINGYRDAERMFDYIYKSKSDYSIVDMNEYVLSIHRRAVYLISILCSVAAVILAVVAYKTAEYGVIRKEVTVTVVKLAVLLGAIAGLLTQIRFGIWVPGFNGGGFWQFWKTLTNDGVLPAAGYLPVILKPLLEFNRNANIAMIAGLVALINILLTAPLRKYTLKIRRSM